MVCRNCGTTTEIGMHKTESQTPVGMLGFGLGRHGTRRARLVGVKSDSDGVASARKRSSNQISVGTGRGSWSVQPHNVRLCDRRTIEEGQYKGDGAGLGLPQSTSQLEKGRAGLPQGQLSAARRTIGQASRSQSNSGPRSGGLLGKRPAPSGARAQ